MKPLNEADIESRIRGLPPLSTAAMEAVRVIDTGEYDYDQLERVISRDPGVASRTLTLANSAFYGFSGRIASLKDGLVVLGAQVVRNVLYSAAVTESLGPAESAHVSRLWGHAMHTAGVARVLGLYRGHEPGECFTAGLLHDLGRLALAIFFPEDYAGVLPERDARGCTLSEAEGRLLGVAHTQVGELVARHWRLPESLCEAIRGHHRPPEGVREPLTDIIHLADLICHALGEDNGDRPLPEFHTSAMVGLKLTCADVVAVACSPELQAPRPPDA